MGTGRQQTTLRLALALAGAGLATSGVVLLLRAAWAAVAAALGPIWASVILGSVLILVGALLLALATRRPPRREGTDDALIARIVTAFLEGLSAGRATRRR